ncbi:metal-binding protein [Halonotius terrestris]|uniref:Metal-binding protein n=1 Tax=Halonotius terrestris TaxID=2487750 RepID=A0A8J8TDT4_9EURY|nr:DUF2103 domain-containing protein [Halonotius terrestris]TQQ83499.1 metal-binding protein [Halonotius terrestris]
MECRQCHTDLDRPGDYCLVCDTANCDAVVAVFERDAATLTMLDGEEIRGETTITTVQDDDHDDRATVVELRNFAGRVADEIRRKRPETVFAAGEREPLRETRKQLHYEFYRVPDDDPVETVLDRRGESALDVVDIPPREKIGGSHSTIIGGRAGRNAISIVADHPHIKKIIPGPIDAGGKGSQSSLRAKITRADDNGNVRMLLRDGSSVQENRLVTTARDLETGERVRADLNAALEEAELQ